MCAKVHMDISWTQVYIKIKNVVETNMYCGKNGRKLVVIMIFKAGNEFIEDMGRGKNR